jgi:hypothetical protein
VQQRGAEVEVRAVRLVCDLAQLLVAFALGEGARVGGRPMVRRAFFWVAAAALACSSWVVRLIAPLTSSRYMARSVMTGRPRSNSIRTPAARA